MKNETIGWKLGAVENHLLRGGWWLLDAETTGFDPLTEDMIAIRLAYMEALEIHHELSFFVQPKYSLKQEIMRLTGITPEDMKTAISIDHAVKRIEMFVADAPLLIYHFDFLFPFLRIAFHQHAEGEFDFPCLSLERLAMYALNIPKKQRLDTLAEQFPEPENAPSKDYSLVMMYRVSTPLFEELENRHDVHTVKDLLTHYGEDQS